MEEKIRKRRRQSGLILILLSLGVGDPVSPDRPTSWKKPPPLPPLTLAELRAQLTPRVDIGQSEQEPVTPVQLFRFY